MNVILFVMRLLLCNSFLILSIRTFIGGYVYAGLASLFFCLLIAFPVIRLLYKRQRILPVVAIKDHLHTDNVLRWLRKGIAAFFCYLVVGSFQRHMYTSGFMILPLCLSIIAPVDKALFGGIHPTQTDVMQTGDWRRLLILAARNTGLLLYAIGFFAFGGHPSMPLLISSSLLMLTKPLVLWLAPYPLSPITVQETLLQITSEQTGTKETTIDAAEIMSPSTATVMQPVTPAVITGTPATYATQLTALQSEYTSLLQLSPQRRGYAFQDFLNKLFTLYQLAPRGAFRLTGEEIDGSFDLGPQTYLLEAKWQAKPSAQSELLIFNSKVEGKSTWARGLFVSYAGFTADGLKAFARGKRTSIIGMDGADISLVLEGRISLDEAIKRKARRAAAFNDFFVPLASLV